MKLPDEVFLAFFFSGEGYAECEGTGLQISISSDGRVFRNIADCPEPLYAPEGGLRDPFILYRNGRWYMVHSYGQNISPVLFLLKSEDLKSWEPVCRLRLDEDKHGGDNYIDVPSWVVDPDGHVHIIACVDHNHHWVEIHPPDDDPATWGDSGNWSSPAELMDCEGNVLIQGNSFVDVREGVFYMCFNDMQNSVIYMRTSDNLVTGWSMPRKLDIYCEKNAIESENLLFLADGRMRFYISSGNSFKYNQWYVESGDMGLSWSEPVYIECLGYSHRVNWAEVARVSDREAIASLDRAGLLELIV